MTQIKLGNKQFDIDGIVFDKDGTLIDFHATWGPILRETVAELVEPFNNKNVLRENIFNTLGVDPQTMRATDGPYSISTFDKIYTVIATVLYQHGMDWTDAEQRVYNIYKKTAESPPPLERLTPTARLPEFFNALQQNNIQVAVATADNRFGTVDTLEKLQCNVESLFLACGDDIGLPSKPDPELLNVIASHWGTQTNKIAMVGDTIGDVHMAKQAGAVSVGVLTGAGSSESLTPYTDVVLGSIEEILVNQ